LKDSKPSISQPFQLFQSSPQVRAEDEAPCTAVACCWLANDEQSHRLFSGSLKALIAGLIGDIATHHDRIPMHNVFGLMENTRDTLLEFTSRDIHQKRGRGDKLTIQRRGNILW